MYAPAAGTRIVGMQLPIQTHSKSSSEPWERGAPVSDLAKVARHADQAGLDYLGVCDHVSIPESIVAHNSTHWIEPIGTLGWVAAQTERAMLLTHVYVVPFRHPRVAAKQFATLDWLSGGRVICGLGAGHMVEEFAGLGVDHGRRGALMDERVPQLADLLEHEWIDGLGIGPRPVQSPRPPIWIAGSSPPAVRRAARLAEGWLPQGPATRELVDLLLRTRDEAGREGPYAIGHIAPTVYLGEPSWDVGPNSITGSATAVVEQLLASAPPEVNQFQVRFKARSADEMCDQISGFADEALELLRHN